jgi:hypothetical protein
MPRAAFLSNVIIEQKHLVTLGLLSGNVIDL